MAGFDINSLLNQLMGKQEQQPQQQEGQPGDQAQMQAQDQSQQPAHAMGAAPSGGGGGLGNLLSSGMIQKLAPMIGSLVAGGGLAKLMDNLKGAGAGSQAKSWVSSDQPNQPVSDEQITQALGHEQISQVANTLGMTHEEAAHTMAAALPQVVDAMTPEGQLPQAATAGAGTGAGTGAGGMENPAASQAQNRPQAGGTSEGRPQGT
ncbi:DUF937 domain-containing protein [Catenulispora sp. NF23]|uniref:DUF937 domain-containing protein n=1 Tax=Catenulispora pinistramenti TaxID=2705254 RepID=A0ABS5KTE3_9ACTN|nr:YidB family protein [Catenulispora pinistramenti]MBS2534597.1 DUF937 domain-containing protein [Catenulispora pinistramenti]MBS2549328.1 DUF937 domain-containing protein [Catenulispora pinistramenti]